MSKHEYLLLYFFSHNNVRKSCAIQTSSPDYAIYASVNNMKMQNVILGELIKFWMQSTKIILMFSKKLKILQAAPVLLNPYPSETKEMNIQYFFHLSPLTCYWFTLFSQQFLTDFPTWIT